MTNIMSGTAKELEDYFQSRDRVEKTNLPPNNHRQASALHSTSLRPVRTPARGTVVGVGRHLACQARILRLAH